MDWEIIISFIAIYIVSLLFLAGAYFYASEIDRTLHERMTYDSHIAIKTKGFKWLFFRCKKSTDEIYLIALLLELICIIIFIASIICFILSFLFQNDFILLICIVVCFLYFCCVLIIYSIFRYKYKHIN